MLTVHCKLCGTGIRGENFPQRIAKLRRHYKARHLAVWKKSIARGVRARAKARRE